jgi:crotonobetainyl-CoA:carnitine CoA-transferase CaiB-like acyl-CoA transferase
MTADSSHADGPLSGLRVLDLSNGIAGGYCTKLLADSGADVVKVEPPDAGDPARHWDPSPHDDPAGEPGMLFWYLHANKRGMTLNLQCDEGRSILRRLLPHYDVVVESWSPVESRALGLTYAAYSEAFERLIWLSITPFGHTGPYAGYQASDLVIQAASGWMAEGGEPDREPLRTAGSISGYITGVYGATAVVAAWLALHQDGRGQHIDLSAFEAMQSTGGYGALGFSFTGVRGGNRVGQRYPFAIVPCKDGWVGVNILTPGQWQGLVQFMGRPELADDPRFATAQARREHGGELTDLITAWACEHTARELFQANEARVPITMLPDVASLLDLPQHAARGYMVEQALGALGRARRPGAPIRMSATPLRLRRTAPSLGEHTDEILHETLGLSGDRVELLRSREVV